MQKTNQVGTKTVKIMSNHTVDKDDNTIEITIKKGDKVCSFETATNTIEEFKDIIMYEFNRHENFKVIITHFFFFFY